MAAVFIPIGFMTGSAGIFYKQFAYTLAIAIIISAVNALTLTPALCALFLKNHNTEVGHTHEKKGFVKKFTTAFNAGSENMTGKYVKELNFYSKESLLPADLL